MKFKVISLDITAIVTVLLLAVSYIGALAFTESVTTANSSVKRLPIYRVETNDKKIAVTFDAAWSNADTDELLEILNKHQAKATVFAVGSWVREHPASVKKFYDAGNEIANHSDTHISFSKSSREDIKQEIENCNAEIERVTGEKPKLVRAPSGDYDNKSMEIAESMGMKMIQWDVDSLDWKKKSVDEMYKRVTEKAQNGSIILFHNGVENTPEALDKILEKLKNDGYTFVTVGELIYWDNYEIDVTGCQRLSQNSTTATATVKIQCYL